MCVVLLTKVWVAHTGLLMTKEIWMSTKLLWQLAEQTTALTHLKLWTQEVLAHQGQSLKGLKVSRSVIFNNHHLYFVHHIVRDNLRCSWTVVSSAWAVCGLRAQLDESLRALRWKKPVSSHTINQIWNRTASHSVLWSISAQSVVDYN